MEKWLIRLESEYTDLYKDLYTELSKLQIEEKFLERQAQSLISDLLSSSSPSIQSKLESLLEQNDPDFQLLDSHQAHLSSLSIASEPIATLPSVHSILKQEFGADDAELYAYKDI